MLPGAGKVAFAGMPSDVSRCGGDETKHSWTTFGLSTRFYKEYNHLLIKIWLQQSGASVSQCSAKLSVLTVNSGTVPVIIFGCSCFNAVYYGLKEDLH